MRLHKPMNPGAMTPAQLARRVLARLAIATATLTLTATATAILFTLALMCN